MKCLTEVHGEAAMPTATPDRKSVKKKTKNTPRS